MIVIPMAGLSSRFYDYGFKKPKYMLNLNGESVFTHSIKSFNKYFDTEHFVFICRDIDNTKSFIQSEIKELGISHYQIVVLDDATNGQAETVVKGLRNIELKEHLVIFNIDTFRNNFEIDYKKLANSKGYLETFIGKGKNWSNVVLSENGDVIQTAEKQEISLYCCTGLYAFSSAQDLIDAYEESIITGENVHSGEFYIAPLYNFLIDKGQKVLHTTVNVNDVLFCGTPSEYFQLGGEQP